MQLYPSSHPLRLSDNSCIYKLSYWGTIVSLITFIAILASGIGLVWICYETDSYGWMIAAALYLLFGYWLCSITLYQLKALFLPSNWLMRLDNNGLHLNFRSYLQQELSDHDITILQLNWNEITDVQLQREAFQNRDTDGTSTIYRWFIEIQLNLTEEQQIRISKALDAEQQRKPAHFKVDDLKRELFLARKAKKDKTEIDRLKQAIKTEQEKHPGKHNKNQFSHRPIVWKQPNILRLDWSHITPGRKQLQQKLARYVTIKHAKNISHDFEKTMDKTEFEPLLKDLIKHDKIIEAIKLVRAQKKLGLADAKQWVEQYKQNLPNR